MNLSFGDEMEEVRKTSVKLKSVEEVTAQRMQEEGRQRASNVRAAAAAGAVLPRDNGSAPGRAQQGRSSRTQCVWSLVACCR